MRIVVTLAIAAGVLAAAPAVAKDTRTRIGAGPQLAPDYPGADGNSLRPMFEFSRAKNGEEFAFAAADDSFGPALFRVDGFAFGPAVAFQGKRKGSDTDNRLPKVGTTIEAGAFAQVEIASFRLRGEARKGLGGHKGVVGSLSADYVARDGDNWLFAFGPRLRLVNAKYNRAYFGVAPANAVPGIGLTAYDPDGGVGAIGVAANAVYALSPRWGLLGYARYDRLTGDAKDSPVVRLYGDRDQLSGGVALTYTFGG